MIELTPEETAQIIRQRQAREPRVDEQRAELLADLAALNERGLAGHYGPVDRNLDAETIAAIKLVQTVGFSMRTTPHGDVSPMLIPSRVALMVIRALRGDRQTPAAPGGFKVPSA
jgi:hypothetical protein